MHGCIISDYMQRIDSATIILRRHRITLKGFAGALNMPGKLHIHVFDNVIYVTYTCYINYVTDIASSHWYIKIAIHTPEEIFIVAAWEVRLLVG